MSTSNTKSSYVPPSMRGRKPPSTTIAAPLPGTKKTALKKEFALDAQAFPTLGDTIKKTGQSGTPISFSSAAAKKVEAPASAVKIDVLPGWVHIRQHKGQIEYKYGQPIVHSDNTDEITSRRILKNRIYREQYDRDRDIDALGDLSEFYGLPSLAETFENDVELEYSSDESIESNDSDYE